jgi:hypothetical protein
VVRLDRDREAAVLEYLTWRADEHARSYMTIYNALTGSQDTLLGVSTAFSSGDYGGEIMMSRSPIQVPRFNLPSAADKNEYLPTMLHHADEHMVESTASAWASGSLPTVMRTSLI